MRWAGGVRGYNVRFLSNIDGEAFDEAVRRRSTRRRPWSSSRPRPSPPLETLANMSAALDWLIGGRGRGSLSASSSRSPPRPKRAVDAGIDETPHPAVRARESAGAIRCGARSASRRRWRSAGTRSRNCSRARRKWTAISASPPAAENVPVIAAFADRLYVSRWSARRARSSPTTSGCGCLPSYLQQLEMESNGKSVTADGKPLEQSSAPVTWGGTGTDAQHAVFQLLHQGTVLVPVEFVAVSESEDAQDADHHRLLLLNAFAQGAALMHGRPSDDPQRELPRQPAERDDPARPARCAVAGRADRLLRAPHVRECGAARHQPVRPVRGRARQGHGARAGGARRLTPSFDPSTAALIERAGV